MVIGLVAAQGAWGIGIGSTREEVIQTLGRPKGNMSFGGHEALTYDGGVVEIENGRVVYIDPNFTQKSAKAQQDRAFEEEQRAKGLVFYDGRWMKPAEQAKLEEKKQIQQEKEETERLKKERQEAQHQGPSHPNIRMHKNGGQEVELASLISQGNITLIDFYADWCGPCRQLSPHLEKLARDAGDVILHKVDIVNWNSPVAQQHKIQSIPNVWVFDRRGRQVGPPTSDFGDIARRVRSAK